MEGEPMKSRRFWVSIITVTIFLSAFGSVLLGAEDANQGSELQTLQAKIDSLEKTIRTQQEHITSTEKALSDVKKQLDEQIKENKRLRLLYEKAGVNTKGKAPESIGPNQPSISPDRPIVYRGHERTKEWFNRMYERFSDKIALAGDKFVVLGIYKPKEISGDFVEIGTIVKLPELDCTQEVISVIGGGEAVVHCRFYQVIQHGNTPTGEVYDTGPGFIYHLCKYDRPLIDGQSLDMIKNLICVGTYKYTTALGGQKTVQSFKECKPEPLTREQFAEAISSGVELVNYVERGGKTIGIPIR